MNRLHLFSLTTLITIKHILEQDGTDLDVVEKEEKVVKAKVVETKVKETKVKETKPKK